MKLVLPRCPPHPGDGHAPRPTPPSPHPSPGLSLAASHLPQADASSPVEVDGAEGETTDRFKKICQLLNCSLPTHLGGRAMGCLPPGETESQESGTGLGVAVSFPFWAKGTIS